MPRTSFQTARARGLAAIIVSVLVAGGAHAQAPPGYKLVPLDMNAVYDSLDYDLRAGPRVKVVIQKFFNARVPIVPLPKGIVNDRFDPTLNVVYWNSTAALQTATDSGAPTGKYISPALLLLDAINDAVAYSISQDGFDNLAASSAPPFESLEKQRVIFGLDRAGAIPKLHSQSPSSVAGAQQILDFSEGNGLENAAAVALGEPVRTNNITVFKDGKAVEGETYVTTTEPTWHGN